MIKILVVEDDKVLNEGICYALRKEGYKVLFAASGKEAKAAMGEMPDLLLLDVGLPDENGTMLLKEIRRSNQLPAIFLTARDTERDMMEGFDAGCDDYITKPFSIPVLMKKVSALLKRSVTISNRVLYSGLLTYDLQEKVLRREGEEVRLTATENKIVEVFLYNRNQVLTKEQLLGKVWDAYENYVDEKALIVNISRIRDKIETDVKNPEYIKTVFGIGYKWCDPAREEGNR